MRNRHTRETPGPALPDAPDPVSLQPDPGPAPESAGALAIQAPASPPALAVCEESSLTPYIDENGFDPADYKWVPVRRRPRKDGWSEARQRLFIEILADTSLRANRRAGSRHVAAQLLCAAPCARRRGLRRRMERRDPAGARTGSSTLLSIARSTARRSPSSTRRGRRVGRRMRQNDRLLMFLLRAHLPDRYRHAHQGLRDADEAPPPRVAPLAEAIAMLEPPTPPDPHLLSSPEELDADLEVADMLDGELPRWYRPVRSDPEPREESLGADFERRLEEAKAAAVAAGALYGRDDDEASGTER
ncbi:MAG: hypothetical protein WDN24_21655 [Sphingomonas sp.]